MYRNYMAMTKNSPAYVLANNGVIKFGGEKFVWKEKCTGWKYCWYDDNMPVNIECAENETVNNDGWYLQRDRYISVWHTDYEISTVKESRYNVDYLMLPTMCTSIKCMYIWWSYFV